MKARRDPTYKAWYDILYRCQNPNASCYGYYGGRGIRVCAKWQHFEGFLEDMGRRPSAKHSIERIDVNGHYTKENCCWLLIKLQQLNRRSNRIIDFKGERMPLKSWVNRFGQSYTRVQKRLLKGWDIERALLTPKLRPGQYDNRRWRKAAL